LKTRLVVHRINTIKELNELSTEFGAEVDIRSTNESLICAHDAFQKADLFEDWIKEYKHDLLILNIKEEGIESRVIEIVREKGVKDFFLLDVTFPFTVKLANLGIKQIAYRVSDLESLDIEKFDQTNLQWIWLDAFSYFPFDELEKIQELRKRSDLKVCLVSPELHMMRDQNITTKILNDIQKTDFIFDAICTKKPNLWH